MTDTRIKSLKIKTGVVKRSVNVTADDDVLVEDALCAGSLVKCKRSCDDHMFLWSWYCSRGTCGCEVVCQFDNCQSKLAKEILMYEKEADLQRQKIEKMKVDCKDEYDVKKQEEVFQESLMMIPDSRRRLLKALTDLKNILDEEEDLKESEEYLQAVVVVSDAEVAVSK